MNFGTTKALLPIAVTTTTTRTERTAQKKDEKYESNPKTIVSPLSFYSNSGLQRYQAHALPCTAELVLRPNRSRANILDGNSHCSNHSGGVQLLSPQIPCRFVSETTTKQPFIQQSHQRPPQHDRVAADLLSFRSWSFETVMDVEGRELNIFSVDD
jgi:hypothetical protein